MLSGTVAVVRESPAPPPYNASGVQDSKSRRDPTAIAPAFLVSPRDRTAAPTNSAAALEPWIDGGSDPALRRGLEHGTQCRREFGKPKRVARRQQPLRHYPAAMQ